MRAAARVVLTPLANADAIEFVAAAAASKQLHGRWVGPPLTVAAFRAKLERTKPPDNYGFAIRRRETDALVGYVEITNIVRGMFLSGYLGYYLFSGHERQGLMTEALEQAVEYGFRKLGLHRLEANIQPDNLASIALVRACGFKREGYSPRYLKVRGRWRDHERWALVLPHSRSRPESF